MLQGARLHAGGFAPWDLLADALLGALHSLRIAVANEPARRLEWSEVQSALQGAMQELVQALADVHAALARCGETAVALAQLALRAQELLQTLQLFATPPANDQVRWLKTGTQWRLLQSPLDIGHAMQQRVLPALDDAQNRKSWIFTSATLGHDAGLSWFVNSCGLVGPKILQVHSPFNYAAQAALYIPTDLPKPAESGHSAAVASLVAQAACQLGGRTLVLTTTLRAMRAIGEALPRVLPPDAGLQVLVQGERTKRELLQRFIGAHTRAGALGQAGAPGAILVACASFWEGIDIAGDALQLLVIDKLPFAPPDDPLVQARAAQLQAQGGNVFKTLHLPQAAIALKQGAGRLIRRESDRGVLVVCDVRLARMGYGRQLIAAMPPMRRLATREDFMQALQDCAAPPAGPV